MADRLMAGRHQAAEDPGEAFEKEQRRPGRTPPGHGEGDQRRQHQKNRRPGPAHYADEPKAVEGKPRAPKPGPASSDFLGPFPRRSHGSPGAREQLRQRGESQRHRAAGVAAGIRRERNAHRARAASAAARDYSTRQAFKQTHGKPSVAGHAAKGAVAGGGAGLAISGGNPIGAAIGAGVGGVGGAIGGAHAKRAYKKAMRGNGPKKLILVEFLICAVIVTLSPLTDKNAGDTATKWLKRMTAVMALFFVLSLVGAGGRGAAKVAAGLGGLVTATLLVSERDIFVKLAGIFSTTNAFPGSNAPPDEERLPPDAPGHTSGVTVS